MTQAMGEVLRRIERGNQLARIVLRTILVLDGAIGAAWTFGAPNRTAVPLYSQPRRLLAHLDLGFDPARLWGGVLLGLALLGLAAMLFGPSEGLTRLFLVLLGGYWAFWFVLNIWSATLPRGSLSAAPSVAIILLGHVRGAIGSHLLTRRAAAAPEA